MPTADLIRSTSMLTSCFCGFGGRISLAQLLANQMGRTVRASFGTYQKISGIDGLNRTFAPLTGVAKSLSNAGGLALSGGVRGGGAKLSRSIIGGGDTADNFSRKTIRRKSYELIGIQEYPHGHGA
ncbi:hypothetical protein [Yokenella regensburgei]|uniref:hypothetical protein n=1 Tax=Yokenella regensburgei TaxID=158877 RepID=UPI0031E00885